MKMAGVFLLKKWGTHFEANDLNKDGTMTIEDANIFADRFIMHHNMEGEKARELKANFQAYWKSIYLLDQETMDRTTYLAMMEKEYTENRARFDERFRRAIRDCVELFDVNNDGFVSEDEFVVAMKCWGIETLDRKYVQSYPQIKPGFISKDVFAESWIAFNTNGDENNADLEKPAMFGLGMIDHV